MKTDIHQESPKTGEWRLRREGILTNGNTIRCLEKACFDEKQHLERAQYLYEVLDQGVLVATEEEALELRWYDPSEFRSYLKEAGFNEISCVEDYSNKQALADAGAFTFIAKK